MENALKVMAILLCAVTMATMSSCSKEDTYQRRIVGKWECIHSIFDQLDDPTNIDPSEYNFDDDGVGIIWEFSSDGTMKWTAPDDTDAYTYTYTITEENLIVAGLLSFQVHEITNTTLIVWFKNKNNYYRYFEFQKVR